MKKGAALGERWEGDGCMERLGVECESVKLGGRKKGKAKAAQHSAAERRESEAKPRTHPHTEKKPISADSTVVAGKREKGKEKRTRSDEMSRDKDCVGEKEMLEVKSNHTNSLT